MSSTSPNKSPKEIMAVHFVSIQPLDGDSLMDCIHPKHHEMLNLSSAPDPGIFFEDPNIMECIHFDDAHPHVECYRRTRIFEVVELPFSPESQESSCPIHKHAHPGDKHPQEDSEKATSSPSSQPQNEEKLKTASDDGDENLSPDGDVHLSPSKDPDGPVAMMYTCTLEYQWSPLLKYCTMEELGYQPIQLM